jgi:hypothetical protein
MVSRPSTPRGAGAPVSPGRPPFQIQILAGDGHLLLELSENNGMLVARGDESRWDEAAKRFIFGMLQWSGQVGIRWKDEAIRAAEQ